MKLLDLFKRDRPSEDLKVLSSEDLITPVQMRTNLEEIRKRKTNIITTIDERPGTFTTMLLELEKGNDHVVIDTLMPKQGNQIIENSNAIRLDYSFEGIMYCFDTRFMETVSGKFPSIKIAFPSIIKKVQKRKSFRISPTVDNPIKVKIREDVTEKAADISEGGLSFYTFRTEKEMPVGMKLEKVMFELPTIDRHIITKAVIRSFIKGSNGAKNRCGIEFVEMRIADMDSIANYVLVRQVEAIRKKAN